MRGLKAQGSLGSMTICLLLLLFLRKIHVCLGEELETDLVLSEKILQLSMAAAELSMLAYEEQAGIDHERAKYDSLDFFDDEPDQAVVARLGGRCFAAFRGTTLTWDDWKQNLELGTEQICHTTVITVDLAADRECCGARRGFYEAYNTDYAAALEADLRECAASYCADANDCVVLTGHSQGGAVAAVAALHVPDLNPYVITFGQPPTVMPNCRLITSSRWYRYVNTNDHIGDRPEDPDEPFSLSYDPVPFVPDMGAANYGHMILLSQVNATTVAYLGLDAQEHLGPLDVLSGATAHSMHANSTQTCPGYWDRIVTLQSQYQKRHQSHHDDDDNRAQNLNFPVISTGYVDGSLCTENAECQSGACGRETLLSAARCIGTECTVNANCSTHRCDNGQCLAKAGSCRPCDEHSDCESGVCDRVHRRCTGDGGLMDDECACYLNNNCRSGRCEGFFLSRFCQSTLANGAPCNEDSDCTSGHCSFFTCAGRQWWEEYGAEAEQQEDEEERAKKSAAKPTSSLSVGDLGGILLGLFLVAVASYWGWKQYDHRRRGYERIPVELNV